MTMGMKVASCKLLVVSNGKITRTHNHPDTGNAIAAIATLLLDETIEHCYIAGTDLFSCLGELNNMMQDSVPGWRMRIANRRRHATTQDGLTRIVGRFFVDYFSIDQKRSDGTKDGTKRLPRRRFDVMNLDLLYEKPSNDPDEQLAMALAILQMCENRGIALRNTKGALGSAMLKKSPKWERGRRSAPRFINREARPYLPGNFYSISKKVREKEGEFEAIPHCYYIDQKSSHHAIALTLPIPHPHSIRARGNYKGVLKGENRRWCTPDSPTGKSLMDGTHMGLVLCKLLTSSMAPTLEHLYPQWARKRGTRYVWLWTPELRLIQGDHRIQLDHFVSAFTVTERDEVLPEYARWSLGELLSDIPNAKYKKGALLSAYGMLAFNGENRDIYRYWGGETSRNKVEIPIAGMVGESKISIPNHVELSTVNVIARGLIEAETRTRSIEYARELHSQGFHIPQIYADGLLVETHQLPFIPENWRVSHSLTNVWIPRPNAILSDQMTKLPGVMGSEQDKIWEQRRREALRPIRADRMRTYVPV